MEHSNDNGTQKILQVYEEIYNQMFKNWNI